MKNTLVVLGGCLLAIPLQAQSLERRIAQAPDGLVRMSFAAREGVCGNGRNNISWRNRGDSDSRDGWSSDCDAGPVRIALEVLDGKVLTVHTYVGGRWHDVSRRTTDLGTVSSREAGEYFLDLAEKADLVFSPILDVKEFPEGVDVALVEGAVANEDHLHHARLIRARSRILVSFGDCAVSGNVTAMRNPLGSAAAVLDRVYRDGALLRPALPQEPGIVPPLLDRVRPLHEVVPVDFFLPGCPPSADLIVHVLGEFCEGRTPDLAGRLSYG